MNWRNMGAGPDGTGAVWMAQVAGGYLYLFCPDVGSPTLTFAPTSD
jgi:hypothetical protein